jgi:hypothetical protein
MAVTNKAVIRVLTLNDKLDAEKGVPGIKEVSPGHRGS